MTLQIDSFMLIHNSCILSHSCITHQNPYTCYSNLFIHKQNEFTLPELRANSAGKKIIKKNHFNLSSESLCKKSSMSTNDIS